MYLARLCLCSWLASVPARAQSTAPTDGPRPAEEAQAQFARGLALSAEEHWVEAHAAFQRSLELVPRASAYFNLALVCLELGLGGSALEALAAFEQLSAPEIEAARKRAAPLRERAKARAGTLLLSVHPADARVEIDGTACLAVQAERVALLDPGVHGLRISAPGHLSSQFSLEIAAEAAVHRRVELAPQAAAYVPPARVANHVTGPAPAPAAKAPVAPSSAPRAERSVWRKPWLWVVVGTLAVGAVVAVAVVKLRPDEQAGCGADCEVLQPMTH